jgi:hypothetical protein
LMRRRSLPLKASVTRRRGLAKESLPKEEAEAILDAACAVDPHAPGIITMLSNLDVVPAKMQTAFPELVSDSPGVVVCARGVSDLEWLAGPVRRDGQEDGWAEGERWVNAHGSTLTRISGGVTL